MFVDDKIWLNKNKNQEIKIAPLTDIIQELESKKKIFKKITLC